MIFPTASPPTGHPFTGASPLAIAAARPSQPGYPQPPQLFPGRASLTAISRSSVSTANFLPATPRKIPIKRPTAATTTVATIIASIFISSASLYQSGETAERDRHQSGCKKDCGKASERFRNIVVFDLFADTRHYDNGEGKSRRSGKTVYRALKNIVIILHIDP